MPPAVVEDVGTVPEPSSNDVANGITVAEDCPRKSRVLSISLLTLESSGFDMGGSKSYVERLLTVEFHVSNDSKVLVATLRCDRPHPCEVWPKYEHRSENPLDVHNLYIIRCNSCFSVISCAVTAVTVHCLAGLAIEAV